MSQLCQIVYINKVGINLNFKMEYQHQIFVSYVYCKIIHCLVWIHTRIIILLTLIVF